MIISKGNDRTASIYIECECGCSNLIKVTKNTWDDLPSDYSITFSSSMFYSEQVGLCRLILRRLKRAFCSLIGKDYLYMDLVLDENEFKQLVKEFNKIEVDND